MNTGPRLEEAVLKEAVREAHDRTGVPGVVAGVWHDGSSSFAAEGRLALGRDEPVHEDTPFRIASITKSFTATLAERCLPLDEPLCRLLSHTGGLRCESTEPLPPAAAGLFSYSSGLIRRVVESLGLAPHPPAPAALPDRLEGTYALDDVEATVETSGNGLIVSARETDPVTGTVTSTSFPARSLGGGVFGFARGVLMSHRLDFPRVGFARIGWVVLPRVES
jgi:beta-lactamase family protein